MPSSTSWSAPSPPPPVRAEVRRPSRLLTSPRTLTRACQAATGRTAKKLIDARAALEAQRLLVHTDLPVAAIGRCSDSPNPPTPGSSSPARQATPQAPSAPPALATRPGSTAPGQQPADRRRCGQTDAGGTVPRIAY
ncbi:helix-turn-helix domain-containing protein [Streptomyces echinatus]|uniref:helix-turn-helix domain-containing protein n=1 Tax=Streptomyces echinatus TaxID=67293 RepID=UPI0037876284